MNETKDIRVSFSSELGLPSEQVSDCSPGVFDVNAGSVIKNPSGEVAQNTKNTCDF